MAAPRTLTNSAGDPLALELGRCRHARVEYAIKALRDTGLDRMPFRRVAAKAAWLELGLAANDLLCWLRIAGLDGELARAEPKALRYRLLHTASVHRAPRPARGAASAGTLAPADSLANAYQRVALIGT